MKILNDIDHIARGSARSQLVTGFIGKTIRNGVLSGEPQHYDINSRKMLTPDVGPGPDLYDLLTICYHSKLPLPLPLPLSSLLLVSLATRRWIKLCRSRRRTGT